MKLKLVSIAITLLLFVSNKGISQPSGLIASALKCEYLSNPIAIASQHPKLSWQLTSRTNTGTQTAYHVLVSSSPALLAQNQGDYWNSGKIKSSNSTQVIYGGKTLPSRTRLYWKVMVWGKGGPASGWSDQASWQMGLLKPTDWTAKWIGFMTDPHPDSAVTYAAPFFRKEFSVNKKIKRATAHVSGLGFYELYINGKKIGDQVLAPAVTNYDARPLKKLLYPYDDRSTQRVFYNTFDVTATIAQNANAVGILLGNGWYNQRDRTVEGQMWYDMPKLIFQLEIEYIDGTTGIIKSNDTWRCTTGPLLKDGIFTGEKYDARAELGAWNKHHYNDVKWRPSIYVKPPTGVLQPQTAPFDKVTRTMTPKFSGRTKDSVYRYELSETLSGWAALKVKGKAGSRVQIRYISEEGEDYGQFDTYILKGGDLETWEPKFTWHAFRKLEITSADVVLDAGSVTVKDVHTDVADNGSFECSDPFLNKINSAYLKTQLANLHGSISSDCPHRERLGYTGDGQVAMESTLLSYHMPQFYAKWLDDMDDARNKKTGFVTHTAPFGGGGGGPAWGSAYVIMPWLYFNYYGDKAILNKHYVGMKQWVEYLRTRTDTKGLIVKEEPGGWCLGDWCTPTRIQIPEPLVNTAYYYHVTNLMSKIAAQLGKEDDRVAFANLSAKIKADFNSAFYDPATKTYWQGRQGADVFALAFGLVPDDKYDAVFASLITHLEKIDHHFDTGILATPLLLNVLSQNDRDDIAYKIMGQKTKPGFGYLLDDKNSTLWEEWNGGGSHSHPMFGSVVAWLYSAIGGINPDPAHAGLKQFIIQPKIVGDLTYCKTSYNSLYGKIRSEWRSATNGSLDVTLEIPLNTSATFVLPKGKITLLNKLGSKINTTKVKDKYVVKFSPGVYQLQVL